MIVSYKSLKHKEICSYKGVKLRVGFYVLNFQNRGKKGYQVSFSMITRL